MIYIKNETEEKQAFDICQNNKELKTNQMDKECQKPMKNFDEVCGSI